MKTDDNLGVYIHVPFCKAKCPYCDFYSLPGQNEEKKDEYTRTAVDEIKVWADILKEKKVDSVYFGGGTPPLIGDKRLCLMLEALNNSFSVKSNCEVTIEVNPNISDSFDFFSLREKGLNRVSIGVQSANAEELCLLGRKHTTENISYVVERIRKAGISNISFDIMLGIQKQSIQSLKKTLDFALRSGIQHISAYMLKIEEGTFYFKNRDSLVLPNEVEQTQLYLFLCDYLSRHGFYQYEISNFAQKGFESHHNIKYWNCNDYLGIGSSAHSCINGIRFFTPGDMKLFIEKPRYLFEHNNKELFPLKLFSLKTDIRTMADEYIMLRLRLNDGLSFDDFYKRFGFEVPQRYIKNIYDLKNSNLINADKGRVRLTQKGFLVSNMIIAKILYD